MHTAELKRRILKNNKFVCPHAVTWSPDAPVFIPAAEVVLSYLCGPQTAMSGHEPSPSCVTPVLCPTLKADAFKPSTFCVVPTPQELRPTLTADTLPAFLAPQAAVGDQRLAVVRHAFQLSLQSHSKQGVGLTRDFHENLSVLFPDAWNTQARKIGAWNHWEIHIDDHLWVDFELTADVEDVRSDDVPASDCGESSGGSPGCTSGEP